MTENLSMRQQKIARQIQRDMADIFSKEAASFLQGAMVTVTAVRVSPDFGYAKIYVSVLVRICSLTRLLLPSWAPALKCSRC